MTVVMIAVMVPVMLGMMFFMHRGHKKHGDHGGQRPPTVSTTTAAGADPAPEHSH